MLDIAPAWRQRPTWLLADVRLNQNYQASLSYLPLHSHSPTLPDLYHKYAQHSYKLLYMRLGYQVRLAQMHMVHPPHCHQEEHMRKFTGSATEFGKGITGSTTMHPNPKTLSDCNQPH